jgi:hypothetical protein
MAFSVSLDDFITDYKKVVKEMRLFQNFSFGTATLDVIEKPGPKWQ